MGHRESENRCIASEPAVIASIIQVDSKPRSMGVFTRISGARTGRDKTALPIGLMLSSFIPIALDGLHGDAVSSGGPDHALESVPNLRRNPGISHLFQVTWNKGATLGRRAVA